MQASSFIVQMQDYDRWARYYDQIYEGELDYDAECNFLKELFDKYGVPEGGKVLDLGCGTGGHAIRLAEMGYQVTGIDISQSMLDIAVQKAGSLPVEFLQQDMRDLVIPGQFDAVICMFGGFGHITELKDVKKTLAGISSVLLPGRPFIVDYWSIGGTRPGHTGWLRKKKENLEIIRLDKSSFDSETNLINMGLEFVVLRGKEVLDDFVVRMSARVYETGQLDDLVKEAGFEVKVSFDRDVLLEEGVTYESLGPAKETSFRILTVALKA